MNENITQNSRGLLLRRLLFLALLIILLIASNLLYQPALNWNAVQTGEAGEVVYAAGFDGFGDEWQQYEGRRFAQMQDGVLRMGFEVNDIIYSASSPTYADFDVQVRVRATRGEDQSDGYGLIFRLSEPVAEDACLRQFVLLCNLENVPVLDTFIAFAAPAPKAQASGYYVFLISPDGYYSIWRGNSETDSLEAVTVWHYSSGIIREGLNVDNQIRVVGQGNQFRFFINGENLTLCVPFAGEQATGNAEDCLGEVTTVWEDDSFGTGKLGLIVKGDTIAPMTVEFDNFSVTIPEINAEEGERL